MPHADHSHHIEMLKMASDSHHPQSHHHPRHPQHLWIQSALKHPGAFTKKAKAAGESTKEFMREVLAHPEAHDTRTRRQANLMKTLMSFHHSK